MGKMCGVDAIYMQDACGRLHVCGLVGRLSGQGTATMSGAVKIVLLPRQLWLARSQAGCRCSHLK